MRLVILSFLGISLAVPTFAQTPAPQLPPAAGAVQGTYTVPVSAAPAVVPNAVVSPNPVIAVPAQNAVIAAPTAARAPAQPALEDIGFDPKVKRDPSGHVIKQQGSVNAPITDANSLRSDSASGLRSDVAGKPVIVPQATTVKKTTTTTTTTVPTVSPSSGQIQH